MGDTKNAIARSVCVRRSTLRAYVKAAVKCGLSGQALVSDEHLAVVGELRGAQLEPGHGESWAKSKCEAQREFIKSKLNEGLLMEVNRLMKRQGVLVPYPTPHRFTVKELGFGNKASTIPVSDCEPGPEVQLDTGCKRSGEGLRSVGGRERWA